MKESKFQEFQEDMVCETRRGTQMHNITPVKGQGKGPGNFAIVSTLLPQDTPQGLCFFYFPVAAPLVAQVITLNNMGINII